MRVVQCPTFNPNNPACSFQFQTLTGGNPKLKPEKSTSYMLGTVLKPEHNTIDLQGSYTGFNPFDFTLGVKNVFNQNPPYANYASTVNNFVGGYDLSYGNPYGRYIYATVAYSLQ